MDDPSIRVLPRELSHENTQKPEVDLWKQSKRPTFHRITLNHTAMGYRGQTNGKNDQNISNQILIAGRSCSQALEEIKQQLLARNRAYRWKYIDELQVSFINGQWNMQNNDNIVKMITSRVLQSFAMLKKLRFNLDECRNISDEGLEALTAAICFYLPCLTHLTLVASNTCSLTSRGINTLARRICGNCARLKYLSLTFRFMNAKRTPLEIILTKTSSSLKNLECLKLGFSGLIIKNEDLKRCGLLISNNIKNLQHLSLNLADCCKVSDEGLEWLVSSLSENRLSLKTLVLDFSSWRRFQAPRFSFPNTLQDLTLRFAKTSLNGQALEQIGSAIADIPRLQHLILDFTYCNQIHDRGLKIFSKNEVSNLSDLEHIEIILQQCEGINSACVETLAGDLGQALPNLIQLILSFGLCYNIDDRALIGLASQINTHFKHLQLLKLDFNECANIKKTGVRPLMLSINKSLSDLKVLDLNFNYCKSLGVLSLKSIGWGVTRNLIQLEHLLLHFASCDEISDRGIQPWWPELVRKLTELQQVTFDFSGCPKVTPALKNSMLQIPYLKLKC